MSANFYFIVKCHFTLAKRDLFLGYHIQNENLFYFNKCHLITLIKEQNGSFLSKNAKLLACRRYFTAILNYDFGPIKFQNLDIEAAIISDVAHSSAIFDKKFLDKTFFIEKIAHFGKKLFITFKTTQFSMNSEFRF